MYPYNFSGNVCISLECYGLGPSHLKKTIIKSSSMLYIFLFKHLHLHVKLLIFKKSINLFV